MEQNTDKISDKRLKNLKPPFPKGVSGNPKGHPKGQRNYATIRREAIISIGKANGKTPEEIEEMLLAKGISEALKGQFNFYKDDLDRVHGSATQKHEIVVAKMRQPTPEELALDEEYNNKLQALYLKNGTTTTTNPEHPQVDQG